MAVFAPQRLRRSGSLEEKQFKEDVHRYKGKLELSISDAFPVVLYISITGYGKHTHTHTHHSGILYKWSHLLSITG